MSIGKILNLYFMFMFENDIPIISKKVFVKLNVQLVQWNH